MSENRKPNEDTPPQRFRYKYTFRSDFGCCVWNGAFELWEIHTFGRHESRFFERDPWEVLGVMLGDVREFEWIDNEFGWIGGATWTND